MSEDLALDEDRAGFYSPRMSTYPSSMAGLSELNQNIKEVKTEQRYVKHLFKKSLHEYEESSSEILTMLKKYEERFNSLDSANEEIKGLQLKLNAKTDKIKSSNEEIKGLQLELNAKTGKIEKLLNLLRGDDISSKRVKSIYNLEMALAGVILATTILFHKALGLMAVPMIIFAFGIFFVSFMSKSKINTMRNEYREKYGI